MKQKNTLQTTLRTHSNWREILCKDPYNLKWQEDGDYILFSYNQLSSDFSIPLVREARGIIFEKNTYEIVCRPFTKFANYGESYAAKVDWDRCWVIRYSPTCTQESQRRYLLPDGVRRISGIRGSRTSSIDTPPAWPTHIHQ